MTEPQPQTTQYDPNTQQAYYQQPQPQYNNQPPPQGYQNNYQGPPPQQYDPNQGYSQYNYDDYNASPQDMSISSWDNVPVDQSEYSHYWDNQACFEPDNFTKNTKEEVKCNDKAWVIVFFVHLAITIIIFIISLAMKIPEDETLSTNKIALFDTSSDPSSESSDNFTVGQLIAGIFISIVIGIVATILHLIYLMFFARLYIKISFIFAFALAIIAILILCVYSKIWAMLVLLVFVGLVCLCCYCCIRSRIPLSTATLIKTADIIKKYPSMILVSVIQSVCDIIFSILYGVIIVMTIMKGMTALVYVYVVFSFYWMQNLIIYLFYMVITGGTASIYFLEGTEAMPSSPVLDSFKRAFTTSFGSASLASFIMAVIQLLEDIIDSHDGNCGLIMSILICIAKCILLIIKSIFKFVAKLGLIYCSTFGVPFMEGCRRAIELRTKKFLNVLIGGIITSKALRITGFGFMILGLCIGIIVGLIYGSTTITIVTAIFSFIFTLLFYLLIEVPILAISDTILLLFAECPKRLRTFCAELSDTFSAEYDQKLKELSK